MLIPVCATGLEDLRLAPNRKLDPLVAAQVSFRPLPVDSPVAVIGNLETSVRPELVVKNAVVHSRRQEVRKSYLNGFLNYLTLFYSLGFNFPSAPITRLCLSNLQFFRAGGGADLDRHCGQAERLVIRCCDLLGIFCRTVL